jgi:hypothetical protein
MTGDGRGGPEPAPLLGTRPGSRKVAGPGFNFTKLHETICQNAALHFCI